MSNNNNETPNTTNMTNDPTNPNWNSNDPPMNENDYKIQNTQRQVNEVISVMQNNIQTVFDREIQLNDLNERADSMTNNASQFQSQATSIKKKMWWKNLKWTLIGILFLLIIIAIIVVVSLTSGSSSDEDGNNTVDGSVPATNGGAPSG